MKVMIAGIGGASLGTELLKALKMKGGYIIYGCDISPVAYGMYQKEFQKTYRVDNDDYITEVIKACSDCGAQWIIPGGEKPMILLGQAKARLKENGIELVSNNTNVINIFSNKEKTFQILKEKNISIPKTKAVTVFSDLNDIEFPCIVKPSTDSGGSAMVFFALDAQEAMIYAEYIQRIGIVPIVQEYIDESEGEFTIGVLSWTDGSIAGSIALKRSLEAKLSIMMRSRGGVISSGYSQGYIDDFSEFRRQAEDIAKAVGSTGPINVQGRVKNGALIPFEINPRFSASSYLRAMAGFNEVDFYLQHLKTGSKDASYQIQPGWYLRTLSENYISPEQYNEKAR
ncbi:MAG: ATP-grasp domain-containing protein [Rhodospirillales bacterium]|nr:ATP-grasp domain-containing protein [Alphaproteobacteria bacterium]USO06213.1 MAG: ATP-grasp domain-containing protein [Rhodospirillales bacterium]HOO49716.1 ATP-grasp domain-containing protein [Alphaproteobacteria bacterium]